MVIQRVHRHMFAQGLSEMHFDVFVQHFADTLRDRGFSEAIVIQSLSILLPLRQIFREASQDMQKEMRNEAVSGGSDSETAS